MKDKVKGLIPYVIFLLLDYYALPLLIQDTGTAMLVLLVAVPMLCLICSVVCGVKQGFSILYVALAGLLFIPSIFVFYNESAWVYVLFYAIIALVGNAVGRIFHNRT